MAIDNYQFTILYRKKMLLYLTAYAGIGLFSLYIANVIYKNISLSIIILGALILPFFFLGVIKRLFIARGCIKINSEGFLLNLQKHNIVKQIDLAFKDIEYYKIFFPTPELCVIEFILGDNRNIEFSFIDFDKENNTIPPSEIISVLNKSIKEYNTTPDAKKILYKHSFIASKKGSVTLFALVVLILIAIALHIFTKQYQTVPVSLLCGFLLLMQLSSQRKIDLNYYKEKIADG